MNITLSEIISLGSAIITLLTVGIGLGKFSQKVENLEKKVDKHNNVIERVFRIESNIDHVDIGVLEANQKHLEDKVNQLQEDFKKCQRK